ncbi:methyl-accepting chemotaxis protein [Uliginosibacterium sp. TH139]|uniref:methyl-accepting chemotaxis protein n=1 Tax=Uliginosibacterium sp. TH139 TaxID=2067453 RepID=UPI0026A00A72|nr:methyl-accepting chemotaxis protein [Uliginosibacterium sp. TH139]
MKVNLPVTDHEVQYEDDTLIVSKTDLKGHITFVNRDFIKISGFTEEELIGKPHNMVRHPDMPPAAFEDFWKTLKAGKPWVGLVKNRCKNGDFYWVEANATPVFESGQVVGYLSVRVKPSRQRVEEADVLYRAMREGRARNVAIREGRVVKTGLWQRLNFVRRLHEGVQLRTKFALIGLLLFVPLLMALGLLCMNLKEGIDVIHLERAGLALHGELRQVLPELQKHRGLNGLAIAGNADARRQLTAVETRLAAQINALDEQVRERPQLGASEAWPALRAEWASLLADSSKLSAEQSFTRHTALIEKLLELMSKVANDSNLELDSDATTFHVMNAAVLNAMDAAEHFAFARGQGAQALARGALDSDTRNILIRQLSSAEQHIEELEHSMALAVRDTPSLHSGFGQLVAAISESSTRFLTLSEQKLIGPAKPEINGPDFFAAGTQAVDATFGFYDKATATLDELLVARSARLQRDALRLIGLTLGIFLVGVVIAFWFVRNTCSALQIAIERFREISGGNFKGQVQADTQDEIGQLMHGLKSMQTKLGFDLNDARERAEESLRLKIGLDSVATNVMIADNDRNIIYMNPSVQTMMRAAQNDIRKDLPQFDVDHLQGKRIDVFHKNPEHQARLLATFTSTYQATAKIGGRTFLLTANPVINERGERLGSVVEWVDRTVEVAVEQEVSDIVSAAAAGDFSRRIDEGNKQGFFKVLAEGINKVVATSDAGLRDIARVLGALAKGDLTEKISADYQGTFADLKNYTNETVRSLEQMLRHIREASETIHTAAGEIASGNTDLSSRTEEQAASLEETASSMEELTSTVKQNAQNARQANKLAEGASEVASRGGDVVGRVVTTMGEINESARKIVDIIGVIDGIAFQTNILALNAAVEAARAGEQGRGFAVVAGEVRNLAQRSAAAAKEIKGLISNSVEKVEDGNRLVETAGKTMEEVVTSIKRVTDIMNEISAASLEQSNGIEQVSTAVIQMDETTQQNAALVEEAAASAEALSGQAATMLEIVRRFRLDDVALAADAAEAAPAAARPAPALPKPKKPLRVPVARKAAPVAAGKPVTAEGDDDWSEF